MNSVQQQLHQSTGNPHAEPMSWLDAIRQQGADQWYAAKWPTRKTEAWKYTSLKALEKFEWPAENDVVGSVSNDHINKHSLALDAYRLVFCDGQFKASLSNMDGVPDGVELVNFAQASDEQIAFIKQKLNSSFEYAQSQGNVFSYLNSANLSDGVFLHVGKNVQLDKPIVVVFCHGDGNQPSVSAPRVLVQLESSASATLIEQYIGSEVECRHFASAVTELLIGENAQLQHYQLQVGQGLPTHIGEVQATLQKNASLNGFHLALGSPLQRVDLTVHHLGEGADCQLSGVYLPGEDQLVDFHTCIEHAVPNCTTNEVFRGIVSGNGRAVFNGRIHIHPQAQKTLAQLNNRNLLTSHRAEVDTKPELEIYADDVQCAHGATVAQLDEEAMHYFRTRGISDKEAEVMLSFGFINELLNNIRLEPVANYLRPMLAERFARDPKLMRHII